MSDVQVIDGKRDSALVSGAWGIFLVGVGSLWLTQQLTRLTGLDDWIPLLAAAVLLGLNAVRALTGLPVRAFTTGLGFVLAIVGVAQITGAVLPVVPLALIAFGVVMLVIPALRLDRRRAH